jgi:hypothetical protein
MTRTFTSTKAALGYAVAVQRAAAGLASRRDSAPGPAPDPWLASSVMACLRRAGLDPHDDTHPVLRAVLSWATSSDDAAGPESAETGRVILALTAELEAAGIVERGRGPSEAVWWRAVEVGGAVRLVATTRSDGGPAYSDPEALRRALALGHARPLPQQVVELDPDAARRTDLADVLAVHQFAEDIDAELARRWGCSTRTARRHRQRLGVTVPRGPRPLDRYGQQE